MKNTSILIVAGEVSGDRLGADLIKQLSQRAPDCQFSGMGGTLMKTAGLNRLVDSRDLGVVGIVEVLFKLPQILKAARTLKRFIVRENPDLVILIDYQDFNARLARFAKHQGCRVLFYVSPTIWAWRYKRLHSLKKNIDHMAVLFAFEKRYYEAEQVPVSFVGHPLTQNLKPSRTSAETYAKYKLNPEKPVVLLCPGSREQELSRFLPILIETQKVMALKMPDAQFVVPTVHNDTAKQPGITYATQDLYNLLSISTIAIAASGTVTLEIALAKVPLLVFYRVSPLTYWIGKRLIKDTKYIGLCNIVAQSEVAREFIQHDATPEKLSTEALKLLQNRDYYKTRLKALGKTQAGLGNAEEVTPIDTVVLKLLSQS